MTRVTKKKQNDMKDYSLRTFAEHQLKQTNICNSLILRLIVVICTVFLLNVSVGPFFDLVHVKLL